MTMIDRPVVDFDAVAHKYKFETGEDLAGVSSVAKIGGADDAFGIASAWGFRLGYEGAWDVCGGGVPKIMAVDPETDEEYVDASRSKDELRTRLQSRGLTPWAKRDKAGERGTWVHDVLESLGQSGEVAELTSFPAEVRGHVRSLYRWFLAFRPEFVALEVQIASRTHGFAGRYDLRVLIEARRLLVCIDPCRKDAQAVRIRDLAAEGKRALGLLDLKTSKGIYPTTHFPQLEGYEGGGVEMNFPATDFRAVVNTNEDGTFDPATGMGVSWATYEDFLGLLAAFRSIRRIKASDPEIVRAQAVDADLLLALKDGPMRSRELAEEQGGAMYDGMDAKAIGRALGKLAKRELIVKGKAGLWGLPD